MMAAVIIATMIVAGSIGAVRGTSFGAANGLLPLAAYAIVRAAFFIIFVPDDALLFSPAATLAHWLILLVPLAVSGFPAKLLMLSILAICLLGTNASFILGRDMWALAWR